MPVAAVPGDRPSKDEAASAADFDFGFDALSVSALDAAGRGAFLEGAAEEIARRLGALCGYVHVRWPAEVVEDTCGESSARRDYFRRPLANFVTESLVHSGARARVFEEVGGARSVLFVAISLHDSESAMSGAIGFAIAADATQAERLFGILREYARFLEQLISLTDNRLTRRAVGGSGLTNFLLNASAFDTELEFAFALVNRLARKLGAEIVGLGRCHDLRVEVRTISGFDTIRREMPGVMSLRQAMEECLDCGEPVRVSSTPEAGIESAGHRDPTFRLHQHWVAETGAGTAVSIPLRNCGRITHIVSFRLPAGRDDSALRDLREIQDQLEPYAGALLLLENSTRSLVSHATSSAGHVLERLIGRGSWGLKLATMAFIALGAWTLFGTLTYRVQVEASVSPGTSREVTCPANAQLEEAPYSAGDLVSEGDVICAFDTTDLEVERALLEAEYQRARQEERSARAQDDRVGATTSRNEASRYEAEIRLVTEQIERMRVVAPYDARILSGDLRSRVGETILTGEMLFEYAPAADWRLELEIPETEIAEFEVDGTCLFSPRARPEEDFPVVLDRIRPSAVIRGPDNVYVGEATASDLPTWVRPGMRGLVRIELGDRPVWWIIERRVDRFVNRLGVER